MEDKINVCLLDFEKEDVDLISSKDLECFNGSIGSRVEITYDLNSSTKYCLLNSDYPPNLHEYNVIVINMLRESIIPYAFEDHQRKTVSTDGETKLKVSHPTNLFDPRPLSYHLLNNDLKEFANRQSLMIVFADAAYDTIYQPVHFRSGSYPKELETIKESNYSFWTDIPVGTNKIGKKSKVVVKGSGIKSLLEEFNDLKYHQTFYTKQTWSQEDGKYIRSPNFTPLIENHNNEIISFAHFYDNLALFVFPDIREKGKFTNRFLTEIAPQILPELFSYNSSSSWLNQKPYWLPNHAEFIQHKENEKKDYEDEISKINKRIQANTKKYQYLHDLISETDDKLVDAVIELLRFIGFKDVTKVDDTKDEILEEDIQIQVDDRLLVIEVKGIGGTSKDSECSQISKVRLRRMKERNSTNVYGLYIVNHERYKPPQSRNNPPFNDTQIQDAINDDRGLLTTWDLYKLYFDLKNQILTKDKIRENFFQYGLVSFRSNLVQIAKVDKIYKRGTIASFELNGVELNNNDIIISEKNGILNKHKILSIQQNKTTVENAKEGRTGILLDTPIEINSLILRNGSS